MRGLLAALALAAAISSPVLGQPVRVIDGDTIQQAGTTWRLWGIDAPETKQWCDDYPAGFQATAALEKLIKGVDVTCEDRGGDRYGRRIGMCRAGGDDLSATMVRLGYAWAFVRYSLDYVEQEQQAKANRLGVHLHGCRPAWEWRAINR
jgi:endonuclease YncB( thermonuclease family)